MIKLKKIDLLILHPLCDLSWYSISVSTCTSIKSLVWNSVWRVVWNAAGNSIRDSVWDEIND